MSRTILVTGASTGIGRAVVDRLALRGDRVFAGVRGPEDRDTLDAIPGVHAVQLDVTSDEEVAAAVESIRPHGLDALVNNAGVAVPAPLVELETESLSEQLDVNLVGVHRAVRACFPLLTASRGRIVQISSTNGLAGAPFLGGYSASKRALEAYSEVLRLEVVGWGIHVAVVNPGSFRSRAWIKGLEIARERARGSVYQGTFRKQIAALEARIDNLPAPTPVVDAVEHAIHSAAPRTRYLPASSQAVDDVRDAIGALLAEIEAAIQPI